MTSRFLWAYPEKALIRWKIATKPESLLTEARRSGQPDSYPCKGCRKIPYRCRTERAGGNSRVHTKSGDEVRQNSRKPPEKGLRDRCHHLEDFQEHKPARRVEPT